MTQPVPAMAQAAWSLGLLYDAPGPRHRAARGRLPVGTHRRTLSAAPALQGRGLIEPQSHGGEEGADAAV